MPKLLKMDTIRLIEAGTECYLLALISITAPNLRKRKSIESRYAPIIGLLGSACELLVKGCLVQAKSIDILKRGDGFYKYGRESIDEFCKFIRDEDADMSFLWLDTDAPSMHREILLEFANNFRLLQTLRAGGLHAGTAPSRDVILIKINEVFEFIQTLSKSKRLRAYLYNIPQVEKPVVSRAAIIECVFHR
jgi:hypothetical protein